jgi:hypothetical protein
MSPLSRFRRLSAFSALAIALAAGACLTLGSAFAAPPALTFDLAQKSAPDGDLLRVGGAIGRGNFGVPVAGGFDMDGDGFIDYAAGYMTANRNDATRSGLVSLVFGDGTIVGEVDTAVPQERVLMFVGDQNNENCGSEIWMDDVNGDGLGDLLICRQNFMVSPSRRGAGSLLVVIGSPSLRERAATNPIVDLREPIPDEIEAVHILGANEADRFAIWARTGDVDGDGIADMLVAADQADPVSPNCGEVYLFRGGDHLSRSRTIDLALFGATGIEGNIARFRPPGNSTRFHLGATLYVADLDGNGRAECVVSAALSRAGASLPPDGLPFGTAEGSGGATDGTTWIVWDDNFPEAPWLDGYSFNLATAPGSITSINGNSAQHIILGEEILGGADYDGDGEADFFLGDLIGDASPLGNRPSSGAGVVFFSIADLKGMDIDLDVGLPEGFRATILAGPLSGAIGSDTVTQGDFDGDGFDDLTIGNPHDSPNGRLNAGSIHVIYGKKGGWPEFIDTSIANLPDPSVVRIALIQGARGNMSGDAGDTLCYSAASGDVDGDGRIDLICNEMIGNGMSPDTIDVGNLIIISGASLLQPPVEPFSASGFVVE